MPVFSHRAIEQETRANYLEVLKETRAALFRLEHAAMAANQDLGATAARIMRMRVEKLWAKSSAEEACDRTTNRHLIDRWRKP